MAPDDVFQTRETWVGAIVVGARPVGGGGAVAPDVVDVLLDVVDVLEV